MKNRLLSSLVVSSLCGVAAQAAALFTVSLDTSALIGSPAGPFALDFQFADGSGGGDGNNTALVSNFNFHGGSWGGPASVSLTDSSFFAEFSQTFTAGASLSFNVSLTTAVDAGPTPDRFTFALLDKNGFEVPTLGFADEFLGVDLNSANPTIETYGTDTSRTLLDIAAPTTAPIPEPNSALLAALLCGCGAVGLWVRRQRG